MHKNSVLRFVLPVCAHITCTDGTVNLLIGVLKCLT